MQRKTLHKQYKKLGISAVRRIGFSFFAVILIGSILLSLPMSHSVHSTSSYLDHLFVATSATCVTGLVTHVTASEYTLFGQIVIILLIQIGGLGFLTLMSMFFVLLKRKLTYANKIVMQEALNRNSLNETGIYIKRVIKYTVCFELIGAICLAFVFIPQFGILKGIYYSLFHAISAFCNAGFDLMGSISGQFSSLTSLYDNSLVMITVSLLIILGGLGYPVILDVLHTRSLKKLTIHSKLVITSTIILLLIGFVFILGVEYNNPDTLGNMDMKGKLLSSMFQTTTLRTAGFNSIDLSLTKEPTIFLMVILMLIGASPASTGGGIKTTTVAVLFLTVKDFLCGKDEIHIFERSISSESIKKAMVIFFIAIFIFIIGTLALSLTNPQFSLIECVFEVMSAYATVGLSIGGSPNLNVVGKLIIMILMFLGRVGSLTIFTAILSINIAKKDKNIKRPKGKIIIG